MKNRNVSFIGSAFGKGAQLEATAKGPEALKRFGYLEKLNLPSHFISLNTLSSLSKGDDFQRITDPSYFLDDVVEQSQNLAQAVSTELLKGLFPVVIGGDHSMAIGTWSGVTQALEAVQNFGLIWIDAHMDAHTLKTTPSGAYHGMPVACLLGHGVPALVNVGGMGAKIRPDHIVQIGVRSFEEGEEKLLKYLGVHVFMMEEVKIKGFARVLHEALEIVTNGTKGFGLSVDLDGFDPLEAPGVGTPVPDGLHQEEVLPALKPLSEHPKFKAFEISEYNPERDVKDMTAQLVLDLTQTLIQ